MRFGTIKEEKYEDNVVGWYSLILLKTKTWEVKASWGNYTPEDRGTVSPNNQFMYKKGHYPTEKVN